MSEQDQNRFEGRDRVESMPDTHMEELTVLQERCLLAIGRAGGVDLPGGRGYKETRSDVLKSRRIRRFWLRVAGGLGA